MCDTHGLCGIFLPTTMTMLTLAHLITTYDSKKALATALSVPQAGTTGCHDSYFSPC